MNNIIKSFLMIVAVAAVAGVATYAAYHKEGQVLGATFSNQDQMDLKIDQSPSGAAYDWVNGFTVPGGFPIDGQNVRPGSHGEQILDIKNVGNIDAKATIKLSAREDTALFHNMNFKVTFDANHDGIFETTVAEGPLTAWNNVVWTLGNIISDSSTDGVDADHQFSGKTASVKIEWSVPAEAGNDIMGSNVVVDTTFGLDSTSI